MIDLIIDVDWLIQFHIPVDTEQMISEIFFAASLLAWYQKLNQMQQN